MSDRRILIITGAGASRDLGRDGPLPLMSDWATRLGNELNSDLPGSAAVLGLDQPLDGEQFEENLGSFLHWEESLPLVERYLPFGGPTIGSWTDVSKAWLDNNKNRSQVVLNVLRRNLYDNFSEKRIDGEKARSAYGSLNMLLGGDKAAKKCATTNYDPSIRIAFGAIGYAVPDGFVRATQWSTAYFEPTGLGNWHDGSLSEVPVLHLHGAVGWYREADGRVAQHAADQPYNPSLGSPVFLPPDPSKDPSNDAAVAMLWAELEAAINGSTHVLVLGHSLHDRALVAVLGNRPKGVNLLVATKGVKQIATLPKGSETLELDFGPASALPNALMEWAAR
jgi:hypothetical protein